MRLLPRRSKSVCSLIAALVARNGAQGNTDRHRSICSGIEDVDRLLPVEPKGFVSVEPTFYWRTSDQKQRWVASALLTLNRGGSDQRLPPVAAPARSTPGRDPPSREQGEQPSCVKSCRGHFGISTRNGIDSQRQSDIGSRCENRKVKSFGQVGHLVAGNDLDHIVVSGHLLNPLPSMVKGALERVNHVKRAGDKQTAEPLQMPVPSLTGTE